MLFGLLGKKEEEITINQEFVKSYLKDLTDYIESTAIDKGYEVKTLHTLGVNEFEYHTQVRSDKRTIYIGVQFDTRVNRFAMCCRYFKCLYRWEEDLFLKELPYHQKSSDVWCDYYEDVIKTPEKCKLKIKEKIDKCLNFDETIDRLERELSEVCSRYLKNTV